MGKGANRVVLAALILLGPACGGGGGGSSGSPAPGTLGGTAASGAPIGVAAVTVLGANGTTASTTTAADGTFTVSLTGLTAPFLVRVTLGGGGFLYSVGSASGTVNVTPFTDLIVRDYYQVQNLNVDNEFLTPTAAPPGPSEVLIIKNVINTIVSGWLIQAGIDPGTFDLITTPFAADGSGFDGILDLTVMTNPNATTTQVVIDNGTTTQTSDVVTNSGTSSLQADTTTVDGSGTSNSTIGTVVPTPAQSALQSAIDGVNAMLAQFEAKVNNKGNQLKAADLAPFLASGALDDGHNATQFTGILAGDLRGGTLTNFSISSVVSFDDTTVPANPVLNAMTKVMDGATQFVKVGSNWFFNGNRRIADVGVQVEHRRDESSTIVSPAFKKSINGDIRVPTGSLTSVSVQIDPAAQTNAASTTWANSGDNPWPTPTAVPKSGGSEIEQYSPTPGSTTQITRDLYFFNAGAWMGTPTINVFPPPGTLISVVLTPTAGPAQTVLISSNATTTSTFTLTSPTNYLLGSANLGGTMTVSWTPPPGFLIGGQGSSCPTFAGSLQQGYEPTADVTPASTSASFNLPATLDDGSGPQAVTSVNVNVNIEGPHGERMIIIHTLDQGPTTIFTADVTNKAMGYPIASDGTNYLFGLQVNDGVAIDNVKVQLVTGAGAPIGSIVSMATPRTGGVPFAAFDGTNYLVVWDDSGAFGWGLSAQLVSPSGALVGGVIDIARPSDVSASRLGLGSKVITFDGTNYFIVFNTGYSGSNVDLHGVFVNTSGTRVGSILPISTAVEQQRDYSVAFDGTNFLVAFVDGRRIVHYGVDPCTAFTRDLPSDVYGQFVSKSSVGTAGALVGSNFVLNQSDTPKDATAPGIAFDGTNYFVTWHEETVLDSVCVGGNPSGGQWGVSGQFVSPAGAMVGSPVTLSTTTGNATHYSTIAFGTNNYLIVSWVKDGTTNGWDIHGRYMDKSGAFVGAEFVIDSSPLDQFFANVHFAGGKFVVVWTTADLTVDSQGSVKTAFLPGQ